MRIDWRALWQRCLKWLKMAWLVLAVLFAIHSGVFRPMQAFRGMATERAAGLVAMEDTRHWLVPLPESVEPATLTAGIMGGVPGGIALQKGSMSFSPGGKPDDRMLVSTTSFDLLVKHPAEAAQK